MDLPKSVNAEEYRQILAERPTPFDEKGNYTLEYIKRRCKKMNEKRGDLAGQHCPECNDEGFIYFPEKHKHGWEVGIKTCYCVARRNETSNSHYNAEEGWQKQILQKADKFIESNGDDWFYIGGKTGAGKSTICNYIGNKLLTKGLVVKMHWIEDSRKLKSLSNTSTEYADEIKRFKTCDYLIIDDLWYGNVTEGDKRLAREIIDYRYDKRLRTIINCERKLAELEEIDSGTSGRILERATYYTLNLNQYVKDMRKR